MLKKILAILTFRDLPINRKFLLFSSGYLFWFLVINLTCFSALFIVQLKADIVIEEIIPWGRTSEIMIRKIRGASISVHKIIISDEMEQANQNYSNALKRLEQCKAYIITMLEGGTIRDISVSIEDNYIFYKTRKIVKPENIEFFKILNNQLKSLEDLLTEILSEKSGQNNREKILSKLREYDILTKDVVHNLNIFSNDVSKQSEDFKEQIQHILYLVIVIVTISIILGILLSIIFGYLMTKSIKSNIDLLSEQIKALSTGEIDLKKRLKINSVDEIGILCKSFNSLIDSIEYVNSFKKIIEEDETIDDIYYRLGHIFTDELGLKCIIYEIFNSKNTMRVVYPANLDTIYCATDILLNCNLCRTKRTGHFVTSEEYEEICKYFLPSSTVDHFCVPIIIAGEVGGVVQFLCERDVNCNSQEVEKKIGRAKQFIKEAQPVLEAKRLMQFLKMTAIRDSLTGLYNRRFLEESSGSITSGILRRETNMAILMCDIDYFKQVNDSHGHDVGDMVLKETASSILETVRSADMVIRYGGEEFMVILMDIKLGNSENVAEKIRKNIEDLKVKIPSGFLKKTISIGICEFPQDTANFWEAVKYADVALYKAKETGRNKVVRFIKDMWMDQNY